MLIHYLKITFRNIWKYKTQSFISIFGLAFAIACFVPALYWMRYETSYDSFYPDAEHIYRIYSVDKKSGQVSEHVPAILKKKLPERFPAMGTSTFFISESNNCKTEGVPHIRLQTLNTDSTFFQVFTQQFVSGDSYQPFHSELDIVLTESIAIGLFGDVEKAIGQKIQSTYYFFQPPYTVTAVVKDPPHNTNLPFDALLRFDIGYFDMPEEMQWQEANAEVYVKLSPHTDVKVMAEDLRDFAIVQNSKVSFETQMLPVNDVRHQLNLDIPFTLNFIRLFVAAGILLLCSAIFNFLNLYLGFFRQRNRELHQRMVHGAKSKQLIQQMLFELTCAVFLALLFGCSFVVIICSVFSGLLDIVMGISELIPLYVVCGIGVMTLILFISFIVFWGLSHFAIRPLSKGKTTRQPVLQHMAVILQLAVSVIFIIAAGVVMMQIRFVDRKDLGFERSGIIQLHGLPSYMESSLRTALIQGLETIPQIEKITTSNFMPQHKANTLEMITEVEWPGKSPDEKPAFNVIPTDSRFAETFRLNMLMGEWWNEGGGEQNVVLNEEAVRIMGLNDPVGTIIRLSPVNVDLEIVEEEMDVNYKVVGVVNDFHTLSLRNRIYPTIFRPSLSTISGRIVSGNILYVHVISGQEQEVIQQITAILPDIDPSFANLRLKTLNDVYDSFNQSEQTGLKLFSILATVCLLISLFGIYAVAAASTLRRRKEIAIRKVVGAKAGDIVRIFFREYILQVVIAAAFAVPVAYLAMSRWLQGYAYRTNIPWWLLAGVVAGVIAVVLLTVLGQVLRAARSNPAEVVKSE